MPDSQFDNQITDSQATEVEPIQMKDFDIAEYEDYEAALLDSNKNFWQSNNGVAVCRRFRVADVFRAVCRDMEL